MPTAGTCGDDPCWSTKPEKSYRRKDRAGTSDGITNIELVSGIDGRATLAITGKGVNLQDVTVPLTPTVRVQLQNLNSELCWESVFPSDAIKKNDAEKGKFHAAVRP